VLGEVDGFFHVGEMQFVWQYGVARNHLCGCGQSFRDCPFWTEVFEHAFGGIEQVNGEEVFDLRWNHAPHKRHVAATLLAGNGGKKSPTRFPRS